MASIEHMWGFVCCQEDLICNPCIRWCGNVIWCIYIIQVPKKVELIKSSFMGKLVHLIGTLISTLISSFGNFDCDKSNLILFSLILFLFKSNWSIMCFYAKNLGYQQDLVSFKYCCAIVSFGLCSYCRLSFVSKQNGPKHIKMKIMVCLLQIILGHRTYIQVKYIFSVNCTGQESYQN